MQRHEVKELSSLRYPCDCSHATGAEPRRLGCILSGCLTLLMRDASQSSGDYPARLAVTAYRVLDSEGLIHLPRMI